MLENRYLSGKSNVSITLQGRVEKTPTPNDKVQPKVILVIGQASHGKWLMCGKFGPIPWESFSDSSWWGHGLDGHVFHHTFFRGGTSAE